jgi:hypothetical protein
VPQNPFHVRFLTESLSCGARGSSDASGRSPVVSVLIALPDAAEVEDEVLNRAFAGNLVRCDDFSWLIGAEDMNVALHGIDQLRQLDAVRNPVRHFLFQFPERIRLGAQFNHEIRTYPRKALEPARGKSAETLSRGV